MSDQCCETAYPKNGHDSFHGYQCTRKGTVERDGKHYCKTHDPERRKAKSDAASARYSAHLEVMRLEAALDQQLHKVGMMILETPGYVARRELVSTTEMADLITQYCNTKHDLAAAEFKLEGMK